MGSLKKCELRLVSLLLLLFLAGSCAAEETALDYTQMENWAYYGIGEDREADLFLICPTADMGRSGNMNMTMEDESILEKFYGALNMERGIYEEKLTLYAPYYRQATFPVYLLPASEGEAYFSLAYQDIRAAFLTFADMNPDRPFVLAGFSQGADMVLRLIKDLFQEPAYQQRLIAAYCIGWHFTDEDVAAHPWMKPATGADDLGSIICFSTEGVDAPDSFIVPPGIKTLAINPLNWKTDSTPADASLNLGACFTDYSAAITKEIPHLTGAYIDEIRGVLIAPDILPADYSNSLFPDGIYHLNDYLFFYRNLQENVALRVETYLRASIDKR